MPTSSSSSTASFASSLRRFWKSPIFQSSNGERSAQKPLLAANKRSYFNGREDGPPPRGRHSRGKLHKAGRGHKRNRHSTVSDDPPPPPPPEAEQVSLSNFARAFRRQMEHLSHLPSTPPCQMETILEASEESEGSTIGDQECRCESVYHTPISSGFDLSDIPHFLNFTSDISPPTNDPLTRDASSLQDEILLLREALEEAKRENQDLNAELAECYDYGRSLRELEIRYQQLLEEVTESNKTRRALTQNMASITDDLRSAKHSQMMLEREADQLRWIIHYYQTSVQEAGISLTYQDEIDEYISSLDYPLQPPPVASYQGGHAEELPTIAESSEDSSAGSTPFLQKGNYIVTPPRTPTLRRVKSPKVTIFSPSAHKLFRSESPVKRDHIPREGSPLKFQSRLWSSDEEEEMDKRRLQSRVSSNGRTSRLDYAEDEHPSFIV
ncbi:hypothetical protein BDM02DRAFT_3108980 [Thelephora ganbajun]|uniref:Uncharacterized protein n=1 Tax=Thelephora ganbajun TaxID=370292 RepID=A0ACB6ZS75_THEGA|nr:hypothetical protein BDM02DRAFT_3108980 [Thelephora ganbajun]